MFKHSIVAITVQGLHSPPLPLPVAAGIAETTLVAARAHQENIAESKNKMRYFDKNKNDQSTFKSQSGTPGGMLNHIKKNL